MLELTLSTLTGWETIGAANKEKCSPREDKSTAWLRKQLVAQLTSPTMSAGKSTLM